VLDGRPCVLGGRSAGARVACRTADLVPGARAVLCLAFPLRPPGRTADRAGELALPAVPVLVVQGGRDPFGVPAGAHVVAGADHAFAVRRADGRSRGEVLAEVEQVVRELLAQTLT
jgi:predicted alpha/beta-hydrolase family hydrolase